MKFVRAALILGFSLLVLPAAVFAASLSITQPLRLGDTGSEVTALQDFLRSQGYFTYPTDTGFFGTQTWKAVAAFQWDNHLEPVGYLGPKTRALLATFGTATTNALSTTQVQAILSLLTSFGVDSSTIANVSNILNNTQAVAINTTASTSTSATATTTASCTAPTGTTCVPGTTIPQPVSPGNGYTPGFGGGGSTAQPDTTPPTVTLSGPTGLVKADLAQTLTATTDENATCAWATSNVPFSSMKAFSTTGGTNHSTIIWDVPYNTSVTYHVKCEDPSGNVSSDATDSFATTAFPLQTTLSGFSFWTTSYPFKDIAFNIGAWGPADSGGTCTPVATDADGYPTQSLVGTNCKYHFYWVVPGFTPPPGLTSWYPTGNYVLTYDGSGTIQIGGVTNFTQVAPGRITFTVSGGTSIEFTITATDPTNYLHNVHMFLASDESSYQSSPFQQSYLNELSSYSILRFMDWANAYEPPTNLAVFNSGITVSDTQTIVLPGTASSVDGAYAGHVTLIVQNGHWDYYLISSYDGASRTLHLASPLYWTGSVTTVGVWDTPPNETWASRTSTDPLQQHTGSGVAYEYQVGLANAMHRNIWINVPFAASDDFITQLATYLKANLDPDLKIYIEYGNENWWEPGSGAWSEAQGMALGFGAGTGAQDAYSTYRSLQIFHLFDQVFGQPDVRSARDPSSDRLVRILSSQTGNNTRFLNEVQWVAPGAAAPTYGLSASDYADAWAVTDYFGLPSGMTASTTPIDQMLVGQKQNIDSNTANGSSLYQLAQAAVTAGVKLIQYEGGEGLTVPDNNQTTINTINAMMRDPAMRAVYAESLNDWQQFSQVFPGTIGNWAQYNDSGYGGQYGFWGQLEDSLQDPTITPRYQPLLDFTKNVLSVDATLPSAPAGFAAVASSTPGVVDLSWNPSTDNVGVRDYNVFRNGVDIGTTSQTTYEDTGLAYTTAYTYVVKALDTSANFSASSTPVTVTTTGPDLTAPTVGIYNPSSGAAVSGSSVTLVATSSDNVSVASVQFKVGNTDVGPLITVNSAANVIATSTTTGDFTGFTNGSYTLNAVSEDTSGNYATSSIPITIDNTNTPTFGLVGWWPLDASTTNWTTGTTLDESGTGANGSLINLSTTTAPISGSIGQALQLNMDNTGTTEYVNLATSSATKLNANFSISVWLNFASSTPCCQNIIDRGTMYGAAMYNLYFNYPGSSNPFPSLIFQVGDGSTTATLNIGVSPSITPLNKWNHLMCESDTSLMSCYIDGTLLGTTTRSAVSSSFSGTDNWFETGVSSNPNSFPFYGGVDDLRIYNRVLTQPEVLQLYDQGL